MTNPILERILADERAAITARPFVGPDYLDPRHGVVAQRADTGRWYITMGEPGFNSRTNNREGYARRGAAIAARARFRSAGRRAEARRARMEGR